MLRFFDRRGQWGPPWVVLVFVHTPNQRKAQESHLKGSTGPSAIKVTDDIVFVRQKSLVKMGKIKYQQADFVPIERTVPPLTAPGIFA